LRKNWAKVALIHFHYAFGGLRSGSLAVHGWGRQEKDRGQHDGQQNYGTQKQMEDAGQILVNLWSHRFLQSADL
jgi:hypothetical protein